MKVLISRPDKIGDVVLALHGAKQLKKMLPNAKVYLHVSEYTLPLVSNINFIDGVIKVGDDLSSYKFDAVVDLIAKLDTAKLYLSPPIPTRIGNAARWFSLLYTKRAVVRRSYAKMNEAEYNWRLISLLDPKIINSELTESLKISDFTNIKPFETSDEYIVLMPGISVSAKPWSRTGWQNLAKLIAVKTPYKVMILGGPAEKSELEILQQSLTSENKIIFNNITNFDSLLGILQNAKGYVGPSTGITHLASCAGLKGVALYPDTRSMHPKRWQPFHSSLKVLAIKETLTGETVFNALQNELSKTHVGPYKDPISAFIICMNEEDNIEKALRSVEWCDEIIVVDSGSSDRTLEIAKQFKCKIISRHWPGHVAQKQFALSQCSNEWVLNLDADEEVSKQLRSEVESILRDSTPSQIDCAGFKVSRIVRFLDRWWDKGGWYPEYRLRFVRKSLTTWGGYDPHERAIVKGKLGKFTGSLYHYTYDDITDQINRINNFSLASAKSLSLQGHSLWLYNLLFNPIFRFFKFYIWKRGFLEGKAGFIVAVNEAISTFLKYAKLWEIDNKQEHEVKEPAPTLPQT